MSIRVPQKPIVVQIVQVRAAPEHPTVLLHVALLRLRQQSARDLDRIAMLTMINNHRYLFLIK